MKKVLIVTYFWPPAGGPGVQRVLKFVKYLSNFGWEAVILTVKDGEYPAIDSSLEQSIPSNCTIYKTNSFEPFSLYKKFLGISDDKKIPTAVLSESKVSFKKKISNWIRLNVFVPDAKIGWIYHGVKDGLEIIKYEKPDIIFSTSPPPTVHLIANQLAKKTKLKWVADFRDPWTDIHYYEDQPRLNFIKDFDCNLEKKVLENADQVTCISKLDIDEDFGKKVSPSKCINIPNGYDEDDFIKYDRKKTNHNVFTMLHLGAVNNERNPIGLFDAIKKLKEMKLIDSSIFKFNFVGNVEEIIKQTVIEKNISDLVNFIDYIPHNEALKYMEESSILVLLITNSKKNNRILPGKTFEYLRAQKFILTLGPTNGETANIINETKSGNIVEYNDVEKMIKIINQQFKSWHRDLADYLSSNDEIEKYSREKLTKRLVNVFDGLIK